MSLRISPRTLVEAFLPFQGAVSLAVIYDSARQVGLTDQPLRLALRRLIAAGDLEQDGRGRAGQVRLTPGGWKRLVADRGALALAFAQDAGEAGWDGTWHLLALSAPETERAVRDGFRREVHSLGAVSISTGLYLTPHRLTDLLTEASSPFLVAAAASSISVRGLTDPCAIVKEMWPESAIVERHEALDAAVETAIAGQPPLVRQLMLAEALEQALRDDPLIPPELRPAPWRPAQIRRGWRAQWDRAAAADPHSGVYAGWV